MKVNTPIAVPKGKAIAFSPERMRMKVRFRRADMQRPAKKLRKAITRNPNDIATPTAKNIQPMNLASAIPEPPDE